jgi:tetratricopeptide (TPR) repeat protein
VTTGNWEALQDFSTAKAFLSRSDKESAIGSLKKAIDADPKFASAYAELANLLMSMDRTQEAYAAYKKATSLEMDGRLSLKERYFIIASHASDVRDYRAAAEGFKSYTELFPNDYLGWFFRAHPLKELGDTNGSALCLKKSLALHPAGAGTRTYLAVISVMLGDFPQAHSWIQQLRDMGFSQDAGYASGISNFVEEKYDKAEDDFRAIEEGPSQDLRATGYSMLARVQAERARYPEALATLDAGIAQSTNVGDRADAAIMQVDKAAIFCQTARYTECFQNLDGSISDESNPDLILSESTILGKAASAVKPSLRGPFLRRLAAAAALLSDEDTDAIAQIARHRVTGEILLAKGSAERALPEFAAASRLDGAIADREYLARALAEAAGSEERDMTSSPRLREALSNYERTLLHPANVWQEAWQYPPAVLGDQMASYLRLKAALRETDSTYSSVLASYTLLRPGHPIPLSTVGFRR